MDNIKSPSKEFNNPDTHAIEFKKLKEEYDRQLKLFGVKLSDITGDQLSLLNEYADIKLTTNLHELNQSYLEEFYYTEQREEIENFEILSKLENDITDLENNIDIENSEIKDLEKFLTLMNSRIVSVSASEMKKNVYIIEQKMEGIQRIQDNLATPKDFNMDDLIAKVELLEKKKKSKQ